MGSTSSVRHYRGDLAVDEERDMCHRLAKVAMHGRSTSIKTMCFRNLSIDGKKTMLQEDGKLWLILQGSPKQGLTLVHFSAQPAPFVSLKTTHKRLNTPSTPP